jgi:hypothetical protein
MAHIDTLDSIKENIRHSKSRTQAKKHLCYAYVLSPVNSMIPIALRAPAESDFSLQNISIFQKEEIISHLSSYSEDVLICEHEGVALAVIPSIYPSSSLCLLLAFDPDQITIGEILRLIECDECARIFKVSEHLDSKSVKMTRALENKASDFFALCEEIKMYFTGMERIATLAGESEVKRALVEQAFGISEFVGCPLDEIDEMWEDDECLKTDLPLYSAFLLSFLLLARENAPLRSAKITLGASSSAIKVGVVFDSDKSLMLSDTVLEWERLAFDRNMLFECYEEQGKFHVAFHPLRRDWSYLGLKQRINFI